jgi:hypothetical protein
VLKSAGQTDLNLVETVFHLCHPSMLVEEELCVTLDEVRSLLASGYLSPISEGRRLVAISLAEAETLRRIIHIRNERATVDQQRDVWRVNGYDLHLSLRCLPGGNMITDKSSNYYTPLETNTFTLTSALESFRYFNCEMYFNERALNILLRALPHTTKRERKHFFKNILMCRRRLNKKWMTSPISKIFVLSDQFGMLQQRALAVSLRHRIKQKGLLLYDAFCKFNFSGNGYLTPGEVWGGFDFLGIECSPHDILDFFNAADLDKDGLLNYRDFIESLQEEQELLPSTFMTNLGNEEFGSLDQSQSQQLVYSPTHIQRRDEVDDEMDLLLPDAMPLQRQISLTPIFPKGQEELETLRLFQKQAEELDDLEASRAEDENEQRIKDELEVLVFCSHLTLATSHSLG